MKQPVYASVLVLGLLCAPAAAESPPESPVVALQLDGPTMLRYDMTSPWQRPNDPLLLGDNQRWLPVLPLGDSVLAAASGALASETGDPHLNAFHTTGLPNRDHLSRAVGAVRIPPLHTTVYGGYLYDDTWSDRFDSLWSRHIQQTATPLPGIGVDERDGLTDNQVLGLAYDTPALTVSGHGRRYSCWGHTPYYHEPVKQSGFQTSHRLEAGAGRIHLALAGTVDRQKRYLLQQPDVRTTTHIDGSLSLRLLGDTRLAAVVRCDTRLQTRTRVDLCIADTTLGPFACAADLSIAGNGTPGLRAAVTTRLGPAIGVTAEATRAYRVPVENFVFSHLDTLVRFVGTDVRTTTAHLSARYDDTLLCHVQAEGWIDYHSIPLWLGVGTAGTAEQRVEEVWSPSGNLTTLGARLTCSYERAWLHVRGWGVGHVVLDGMEELSVPWHAGITLGLHSQRRPGLSLMPSLTATGPVTQRYVQLDSGAVSEERVDARLSLDVSATVPVLLPLLRQRLRAAIEVSCGPVQLLGDTRVRQHPRGNLTGPRISVGGRMWLRTRSAAADGPTM